MFIFECENDVDMKMAEEDIKRQLEEHREFIVVPANVNVRYIDNKESVPQQKPPVIPKVEKPSLSHQYR